MILEYDGVDNLSSSTMTISGEVSNLLKGLESTNISPKDIIGMPITNQDGKVIGKITNITDEYWFGDVDSKEWFRNMGIPANIII